jgi:hypothetical protein
MIIHVVSVSTREKDYISHSQMGWNGTVFAEPTSALQHNVKHSPSWKTPVRMRGHDAGSLGDMPLAALSRDPNDDDARRLI